MCEYDEVYKTIKAHTLSNYSCLAYCYALYDYNLACKCCKR